MRQRYKGPERRKTFRKAVDFGLDIVRVNQVRFKTKWNHEVGLNIGMGGFCCVSFKKLPANAIVSCLVLFPKPYDSQILELEATLLWQKMKRVHGEPHWYHGFVFTDLRPASKQFFETVFKA